MAISGKKVKTIFETKEYGQFKPIEENRVIINEHLKGLKEAIESRDLGRSVPIIVNERGEIFDGHHRFKARKELNLPIYFVNHPDLILEDVTLLNVKRRNWTFPEYGKFYSKLFEKTNKAKYQHYPRYQDFKASFVMSDTQAIQLFTLNKSGKKVTNLFKEGTLECPDYDYSMRLGSFIDRSILNTAPYKSASSAYTKTSSYVAALWFVFEVEEIDTFKFVSNIEKNMKKFHPKIPRTVDKWLMFFEEEIIRADLKKGNVFPELSNKEPLWLTQAYLRRDK